MAKKFIKNAIKSGELPSSRREANLAKVLKGKSPEKKQPGMTGRHIQSTLYKG